MLIINADDYGKSKYITDNIISCYQSGRLSSASAMVFMDDSERAAEIALEKGFDAGLHLNFTEALDLKTQSSYFDNCHLRIMSYLKRGKYWQLVFNPLLHKDFEYSYKRQIDEYVRLYKKMPSHIDGHHHMHLCANVLFSGIIPRGLTIRKSHSFKRGEKSPLNRLFRKYVDSLISHRYRCVDHFYSIQPISDLQRHKDIAFLARSSNVELMIHPGNASEMDYMMSERFGDIISAVQVGAYKDIKFV